MRWNTSVKKSGMDYLMEKGSPEIDKLVPGHIMIDLKNKFPKSR